MAKSSGNKKNLLDPTSYQNHPDIERAWAGKAVDHMEVHFNLITSVNPKTLKLTQHDEVIYKAFQEQFPNFRLDVLEEDSLKSNESKDKWHTFCTELGDRIDDGTFGVLIRLNSSEAYSEENTIFVVRMQFLAIEIARNRRGLNNDIYEKFKNQNTSK